ncbi:MAG: hypothetical protein EXS05_13055 [Planctomycetaceae bacterium]|nr:hypothetical protein [Planctomycetaceae bacterium]
MNSIDSTLMVMLQVLQWLHFFILIAGLVVSLRFRRLSGHMLFVIAGFLGQCAQSGLFLSITLLQADDGFDSNWIMPAYVLSGVVGLASGISLVVGLALVWKDLRDRIEFLGVIHDDRHQQSGETAP